MNKKNMVTLALFMTLLIMTMTSVMAAEVPDKIALVDGIAVSEVMEKQHTVVSVGEVPDPKYQDAIQEDQQKAPTIREVVLKDNDGFQQTMTLGEEVKNFDQIRVGDIVTFTISKDIAIYIGKEGEIPGMGESKLLYSAAKGSKPGALQVKESFVTLDILKLNKDAKEVTVRLPDGAIKSIVTPKLDFSSVKVGQTVIIREIITQKITVTAP